MKGTLRILALEDMHEDVELIERTLKGAGLQFETRRVDSKDGFIKALQEYEADVILSDHSLPQFNSVDALKICQNTGNKIPFILVTGAVSEEFAVNCLKQGADDYVLKSNLARLPNAILNAIRQKDAQLAQERAAVTLQSQNQELLKINKELDSFVYSVSHNLRAPLMSVLGLLDLAKHEGTSTHSDLNQYLSMMEKSIHKLDDTLKEILDYSRNARQNLTIESVDIRKVINENFEKMQFMPGSEIISKKIDIDDRSPFYSDHFRFSVIVNNLISNAIKYYDSKKKNPFIKISSTITPEKALLEFRDNGIGIESQYLSKVFEMFFRATGTNEGAGLGLYIVKETVDKLNGKITIESALGEGTAFRIELPNYIHSHNPIKDKLTEVN
ncbi:MAG: sensor histidine kinase [Bacteroidota bacterium]